MYNDYLPRIELSEETKSLLNKRRRRQLVDDILELEKKREKPLNEVTYLASSLGILGAASYIGYKIGERISNEWDYLVATPFVMLSLIPRIYDEKLRERFYNWRIKRKQREIDMIDIGETWNKPLSIRLLDKAFGES